MQPRAIKQASERFASASAALAEIERAESLPAMEASWHDLLAAAGTIYSKLEQGAKRSGPSEAWFARRKAERKQDPLLQYAHQARNSAEHSIEDVAHGAEIMVSIRAGDLEPGQAFGFQQMPDGRLVPATTGDPGKLQMRGRHIKLVAIRNRGVTYEPPETHLGAAVVPEADEVGRHLLRYLEGMIEDAETLPVSANP